MHSNGKKVLRFVPHIQKAEYLAYSRTYRTDLSGHTKQSRQPSAHIDFVRSKPIVLMYATCLSSCRGFLHWLLPILILPRGRGRLLWLRSSRLIVDQYYFRKQADRTVLVSYLFIAPNGFLSQQTTRQDSPAGKSSLRPRLSLAKSDMVPA